MCDSPTWRGFANKWGEADSLVGDENWKDLENVSCHCESWNGGYSRVNDVKNSIKGFFEKDGLNFEDKIRLD